VPFPLLGKIKEELDRLKEHGVIREVIEPTEWCAPMVPVLKRTGKVRICSDFKNLNKKVKREYYMLPTLEDIAPKLAGAKVFSSLDAASGYFQIALDPSSALYTTFMTPFGRFCYQRLPMGITSAPEIFQRKMSELLSGHEGCEVIMDDILVYGRNEAEHDARLEAVLETIKSSGLKLNKEKCHFRKKELTYFGHIVGEAGIKPNPEKVRAIMQLEPPTNVKELRSVMGMLNYLSKFTPNMSETLKPLSDLLSGKAAWQWGVPQDKAFRLIKCQIAKLPSLSYYRMDRDTIVSADASSYGLGAVILQRDGNQLVPIAFSSRTLTEAEKRYAQIEKECLASVWACEKFAKYLVGLETFELLTDHKPLVPLMMTKDLDQVPIRCQRLLMRLMRFNPKVSHVPGKQLVIADALSRSPMPYRETDDDTVRAIAEYVDSVQAFWPASSEKLQNIKTATTQDAILKLVAKYTSTGWPAYISDIAPEAKPFFQIQGELSIVDGLLTYGSRIVIPESLRKDILDRLHEGHQGKTKCRERAATAVWWPGIGRDIDRIVETCHHCQVNRKAQRHEPLHPTRLPDRPWEKLAADLCDIKGTQFLVVIDYYSRWIEIRKLGSTSSAATIGKFKDMFATHGIPDELFTDNGPQFSSSEFKAFALDYGFTHGTSSPHFPQANGEAERAVQTAKKILKQERSDLALLAYRTTPHSATGVSPAEALMARQLRTRMPVLPVNLLPEMPDHSAIKEADKAAKAEYKRLYDRRHGVRSLPPLSPGQTVRVKNDAQKAWDKTGTVVIADPEKRTYVVNTPQGEIRRNRKHLQSTGQSIPSQAEAPTHGVPPSMGTSPLPPLAPSSYGYPVTTSSGRMVKPPRRYPDV
jgi:transposase InsO family protein